jgi:hypothetical protein
MGSAIGIHSLHTLPGGTWGSRVSDLSEMHLLQNEFSKERRHLPIRQLLKRAGGAVPSACDFHEDNLVSYLSPVPLEKLCVKFSKRLPLGLILYRLFSAFPDPARADRQPTVL